MSANSIRSSKTIRSELCALIGSVEDDDPAVLHSYLNESSSCHNNTCNDNNDTGTLDPITPIMVACDKRKPNILMGLLRVFHASKDIELYDEVLTQAVGSPDDHTSAKVGGNTAMHLAAASGTVECLQLLYSSTCHRCQSIFYQKNDNCDDVAHTQVHLDQFYCKCTDTNMDVFNVTNCHHDTPAMIAVFSNHMEILKFYINLWEYRRCSQPHSTKLTCPFTRFQNKSGDTVLSLAVGHGRLDMLNDLLNEVLKYNPMAIDIVRKELKRCDDIIQSLSTFRSRLGHWLESSSKYEEIDKEMASLQQCRVMISELYEKILTVSEQKALLVEQQLLESIAQDEPNNDTPTITSKKSTKRCKEKTKQKKTTNDVVLEDEAFTNTIEQKLPQSQRFITLDNGHVISKADLGSAVDEEADQKSLLQHQVTEDSGNLNMFVDKLFLQRCPEAKTLYLDATAMLLSTHAMAMKLSPCQLDAIISLLETQLKNAKDAKAIHKRLHQ